MGPDTEPGIAQREDLSVASVSASRSHYGGDRYLTFVKSCSYSQGLVLRSLNLSNAGGACIETPDWGTVVGDQPFYRLVRHQYRFLLLSPGSASQGFQDVVSVADSWCRLCAVYVES